jgi:DNA primase
MNITPELKHKIRCVNLYDYLVNNYGVRFHSKSGSQAIGECPHPDHDDHKPSFVVRQNEAGDWGWWCQACHCGKRNDKDNYGSDIIAFEIWMSTHKKSTHVLTFQEACLSIMKKAGIAYSDNTLYNKLFKQNKINMLAFHENLTEQKDSVAYNFLINRGLDDKDIEQWNLGYDGNRICIPLIDKSNQVRGFTKRQLYNDGGGKYINSQNSAIFNKSKYLYGISKIDTKLDYIILTEGQFDVILSYKYGLKNVLAISGSYLTEQHLEILKSLQNIETVILAFDNDNAGKKATEKSARLLYDQGFLVQYLELPEDKDLCDYASEYKEDLVQTVFDNIVPYYYMEFKNESAEFNKSLIKLKNKYISKIYDHFSLIKNKKEKQLFCLYIKDTFGVEIKNVE